jgi:hypothetical protein
MMASAIGFGLRLDGDRARTCDDAAAAGAVGFLDARGAADDGAAGREVGPGMNFIRSSRDGLGIVDEVRSRR